MPREREVLVNEARRRYETDAEFHAKVYRAVQVTDLFKLTADERAMATIAVAVALYTEEEEKP